MSDHAIAIASDADADTDADADATVTLQAPRETIALSKKSFIDL